MRHAVLLMASLATAPTLAPAATLTVGPSYHTYKVAAPRTLAWTVRLNAGQDYAYATWSNGGDPQGTLTITAPNGRRVAQVGLFTDEYAAGGPFRAAVSGNYRLTIKVNSASSFPADGYFVFSFDCRGDTKTKCELPIGKTLSSRNFVYSYDSDWYATSLAKGASYEVTETDATGWTCAGLAVYDKNGTQITNGVTYQSTDTGQILDFTAPYRGLYCVEAVEGCDTFYPTYSIGLRTRSSGSRRPVVTRPSARGAARRTLAVAIGAGRLGFGATKLVFRGTVGTAKLSARGSRAGWRWWRRRRTSASAAPLAAPAPLRRRFGMPRPRHVVAAVLITVGATTLAEVLSYGSDPAPASPAHLRHAHAHPVQTGGWWPQSSAQLAPDRPHRDPAERRAFVREHPCPATGRTSGACPGYVVDHIRPLRKGGPDRPMNMQWQTTAEGKAKDRVECR